MKTLPLAAATAMALALAACGGTQPATDNGAADVAVDNMAADMPMNDTSMASDNMSATAALPAADYIAKAGAGDKFEIDSSNAVLAKTKNADVKAFANMMIANHKDSTEKVKAAAKSANLTVAPPKLDAEQQAMVDEIKSASADTVDAVYIKHQRTAHQKALDLHSAYAASGDTPSLKTAAGEIKPVVEKHITELSAMKM